MEVHVSVSGRTDLAAQIYRQLHAAILDGRLRPGERMPPSRELASRIRVSRNTVAAAYERLTAEGFLEGRVGAGTYVCGAHVAKATRARRAPVGSIEPRALWRDLDLSVRDPPLGCEFDFRVGVPDPGLFPLDAWRRLVAAELRRDAFRAASYGEPSGHPGLRAAVARHLGTSRSVRVGADDVVVTHGAQQALDVIGRVLVDVGTCVAVERPGYAMARELFRTLGARVVGVPVDSEGLDVSALPAQARLVYTTPSHQFPLGTPMSLARRTALLAWAEHHRAAIIEDDYDSEFRYGDRPLEPLQSLDRSGRVIYVGSFSKTLSPMLRLGFLVAPASLRNAVRRAKQVTDWHTEVPSQAALARFIDDGLLARHIRRASRVYAERHALISTVLRRDFAPWFDVVPSSAGLHLCVLLRDGVTVDLDRARELSVGVADLSGYGGGPGLVLGFGMIPAERIPEGLRRLGLCVGGARVDIGG
ncbi:GntR family transcriptional regulator [Virgisporangium aliadipatigenens]|uniref:GntR family transcriptional regulator n=1 Tax=Virgisporangium aliadipatigenens TaxID=741659 RepID=A0A8J4DXK5_9ACTN|nr:PLP-dependent aminotransferase family protein [Virgisporangium aliadipatigenens]GIJ52182.1 GntR family transcriptional regulator [Virgisporangium aliadipatigenens]